jgi:hypothetical protein
MTKKITLEIQSVPDIESVKTEILTNAETTIRNYLEKTLLVIPKEQMDAVEADIVSFRQTNSFKIESVKEIVEPMQKEDRGEIIEEVN